MKGIIGLAAGLLIGFGSGFLTGKKVLKKKFQAKLDEEISAIKDTQNELQKRRESKKKAEMAEKAVEEYKSEKEPSKPQIYISTDGESEVDPGGEDDDIGEFEADNRYMSLKEILKKDDKPYNITAEEFEANSNKFDKSYVTYNSARDLVTDNQTGMTLDDGWCHIGGDAGCIDDDRVYDDGFYYVRNERLSTDFCIDKCSVV